MTSLGNVIDRAITINGKKPREVARTVLVFSLLSWFLQRIGRSIYRHGLKRTLFSFALKAYMRYGKGWENQLSTVKKEIQKDLYIKDVRNEKVNAALPKEGIQASHILSKMKQWSDFETQLWNGNKRISSGAVYHGGQELTDLQTQAYTLFSVSNPLHPDVFPFTRKLESEIIAMSISYLHGDPYKQVGLLTSGGTESIFLAVRAYKRRGRYKMSIEYPELIVPQSAHTAFAKACEILDIKLVQCPINPETFKVEVSEVKKLITSNTIAIVGSAPMYAAGVLDPIPELGILAKKHNVGLHVDCCLGSFLLPTLVRMGYDLPPFDFRCPGVTTISCDTHKFGYTNKGSSVLMFRDNTLRWDAYFTASESSIGLYATPSFQGSRSGGIIAAAWACLMNMGEDGYLREAKVIMDAVNATTSAIKNIDGITLAGDPCMSVFGVVSSELDVYKVSSAMSERGWTLNNCKDPPMLHICVTRCNCEKVKRCFASDLASSVLEVRTNPSKFAECSGAMYGSLVSLPVDAAKDDMLKTFLDVMLGLCDANEIKEESHRVLKEV